MLTPYYQTELGNLYHGDCLEVLKSLKEQDVRIQTCITSPPYWGLRDYGVEGQLGLESTPEEYTSKIVEVFGLVKDLLAEDGTLWLNLGDSYAGLYGAMSHDLDGKAKRTGSNVRPPGLKPKDLTGIPWRVAFGLQADGWYLRQDIIWHKPNPMPESVTDRCTKSHEYIFLLSKNAKYFYDYEAIKEKAIWDVDGDGTIKRVERQKEGLKSNPSEFKNGIRIVYPNGKHKEGQQSPKFINGKRNKRSVWTVNTKPFPEAHFATYPLELIIPCVLAGSRPGDIVLDPFFGAGTTGYVCEKYGRKWIGTELNKEYCDISIKRIEKERNQLNLSL